ncbi:hypothetical protein ScalyP_jg2930 [Parmales sp. scaly parma]|nr:hypothetical protein ScalyP_jg2930 [Parmales sp. scaly parma]
MVPEVGELKKIVMGAGSEVQHLMAAFKDDAGVRVVSMLFMGRFDRQDSTYRKAVVAQELHRSHRHGGGGERTLAQVQRPGRKGNSKTQRTEVAIEAWLVEDERLAKVAADLEDEDDDESYNRPGRF